MLGVSARGRLLWHAGVCAERSHLACLTLQLWLPPSEGDWGKLGILCDDWSQVTAVQGCQALPADTISAGSDEEESVLQQKHKGREGVLEYS